jgi:hypothetical protein
LAGSGEGEIAAADACIALSPVAELAFEKAEQGYSLAEVELRAGIRRKRSELTRYPSETGLALMHRLPKPRTQAARRGDRALVPQG